MFGEIPLGGKVKIHKVEEIHSLQIPEKLGVLMEAASTVGNHFF